MARQKNIILSGHTDDLIFSSIRNKGYIRSKPKKIKQTKATKTSASLFGQASRMAKCLRLLLNPVIAPYNSRPMINSLNTAMFATVQQLQAQDNNTIHTAETLLHYQFNKAIAVTDRLHSKLSCELLPGQGIQLILPALVPAKAIGAPVRTQQIQWNIMAACCQRNQLTVTGSYSCTVTIPYNNSPLPENNLLLPLALPPNLLAVLVIQLQYYAMKKNKLVVVNNKRWMPCGVVGAWWG